MAKKKEDATEHPAWWIYNGRGKPDAKKIDARPDPPRWRTFKGEPPAAPRAFPKDPEVERRFGTLDQGARYRASHRVVDMVNAALYLRRPLLVTGKPGTGKSSLAYSIAYELDLGPVLEWPINSRSRLREGLYSYDAIGRLQEANLSRGDGEEGVPQKVADIGRYLRLGALGTALLPSARPRVLLIDEIDKADIDLPNDLLHVFETGTYEIPELSRLPKELQPVAVPPHDSQSGDDRVEILNGKVTCHAFPVVILTSNGERDFPPAFKRRCLRLDIKPPERELLGKIVSTQLGQKADNAADLIDDFLERREKGDLATDQLLNALYLVTQEGGPEPAALEGLIDEVFRYLNRDD